MVFSNFVWCCAKYGKVRKVFQCFSFESTLKVGLSDGKEKKSGKGQSGISSLEL